MHPVKQKGGASLTKYFMVSLMIQQLYREILAVADVNGGRLSNRVVFYADALGTLPAIDSLELIFRASRSRRLTMVPIIQTAEVLSKALGSRTVLSGTVNRGKNDPSQSLQMMERPLMTPDELKSIPKGSFVVMKTDTHPIKHGSVCFLNGELHLTGFIRYRKNPSAKWCMQISRGWSRISYGNILR